MRNLLPKKMKRSPDERPHKHTVKTVCLHPDISSNFPQEFPLSFPIFTLILNLPRIYVYLGVNLI